VRGKLERVGLFFKDYWRGGFRIARTLSGLCGVVWVVWGDCGVYCVCVISALWGVGGRFGGI